MYYEAQLLSILVSVSIIAGQHTDNKCSSKVRCSECIRTSNCAWCYQSGFKGVRCFDPALVKDGTGGCDEDSIYNPDNLQLIEPIHNKELSRARSHQHAESTDESTNGDNEAGAVENHLVQLKPQKVQLQLRKGQMLQLKFAYSQAQDYPVDLYYLMDLSSSMENDKEKLSTLGKLLSSTMKNITSNFRIGFGSFVDKVTMPFVSTIPEKLISPCDQCAPPYGYKNQMALSSDTDIFDEAVKNSEVSGNLDSPEGGFDALIQAIVCKEEIGWRDNARKLIIFSTDANSHLAGDGKIAGIVKRNDGECHMENNVYTHSNLQDYPSISQINNKVMEHSVNVIFAVTAEQLHVYEQLKKRIQGSGIGILSDDSSNIISLVLDQYNQITSSIEIKDNSSDAIETVYYSSCLKEGGSDMTNKCNGLKTGNVVRFTTEISLIECPEDPKEWKQIFVIQPVGVSESLIVELEMHCDCPCKDLGLPGSHALSNSSSVCNNMGSMECGVCVCNPGRLGEDCQCSIEDASEHESTCRPSNSTRGALCSNRGNCLCGQCECKKMSDPTKEISGRYCECDNFSCDIYNGQICSGPDHGKCLCGRCECSPEYAGPACQCPSSNQSCISPETGELCNGNGKCDCGKCVCETDKGQYYTGDYCKCLTCSGSCLSFKDCVLCQVHKKGPLYDPEILSDNPCGNCSLSPVIEGKITAHDPKFDHMCTFYDEDYCMYEFIYSYNITQLTIRAQKDLQCPKQLGTLTIVLSVIGCVVLPGLMLLFVWKIATLIHDKREFTKFEKERRAAKWNKGDNPLYVQPTSTFSNPSYEQASN